MELGNCQSACGVNVSILKCAYSEITAGHKVHIYVCDLMYHKLHILFHLASQREHAIFFQALCDVYSSFVAQKTHLAINQICGQCLRFSTLKCLLIKKKFKDYIHLLHCSNLFKNSIEISHSLIRKNLHRITATVFWSTVPLLQRKHIVNESTPTAQLSINSSRASMGIVPSLIKIAAQNEEMAGASCNKRAGTHSGTTVAAPGGWGKQDAGFVVPVVVALRVLWLPCRHLRFFF